ncbi:DnaJ protein, putative [Plasmodium knowlesi strain H]|uniref:DnaJ protein, putative n=3 Tax=Plasmodium knowlesi TaxID=5850 RepID=A0A5K1TWR1_PLAKH|nr:peptidase, putative [Plasmodium knowlesi strain H]OTN65956.1 putative DnaJ protein [Plasmodium knowlesi]CAA9987688.1 peptidase, putative [Plasmodium knowlesi strain H]SBO26906.1 DnaJ protein, putative [Plasmodium knowlesi strain H]SBO29634.1 DnaJ protein, putative [Plasmodium knowlesi strain H]VVS77162.1 peptidase, putative [Plasmodium knowlesi strain H]|eukprot:XP_002258686.1 hypothetical protein, conserved in Plasmodium species [Plasmodium knowlesi strain H]
MNAGKRFIINKCIFLLFSKISPMFCGAEKRKLQDEIVEHVKSSKLINYPVDKTCINLFHISKEIDKLINARSVFLSRNDQNGSHSSLQNCLNLYYFLITCAKLKKITFFHRKVLEYVEDRIATSLQIAGVDRAHEKYIPYSIHIKNEKSVSHLVAELHTDCAAYLKKINSVKIRYLTIDRNQINIDEEWKQKHQCAFNKKKLKIPISKHNYEFILNAVTEPALRQKVLTLLNSPYEKKRSLNKEVIKILKKRYDVATKLGYRNWVDYSMSHFTSEKGKYEKLRDFFNVIKRKVDRDYDRVSVHMGKLLSSSGVGGNQPGDRYGAHDDRRELRRDRLSPIRDKPSMQEWSYYYNKSMNKSDEYFVNTFFPHGYVWKNFMEIVSRIYNFSYEEVQEKNVTKKWPKGSLVYKIERRGSVNHASAANSQANGKLVRSPVGQNPRREVVSPGDTLLGYMYIVPYMEIKIRDYFRVPSMNCLSNTCLIFTGHVVLDYKFIGTLPIEKKLFSCSEILTLFHEFGHAYHLLLLSRKYGLYQFSNMPLDYAEFFSHMNEHLVNNFSVLQALSNKADNNSKINEDIFKSIKFDSSRLANIYTHAVIDYEIHNLNPHDFFTRHLDNPGEVPYDHSYDHACGDNSLVPFYNLLENYLPYKIGSSYSIHSTSFPYHFSCYYAGSVLSYLLAEMRVLMNMSTGDLSMKRNSSLVSFQKKFYGIVAQDFVGSSGWSGSSVIDRVLANRDLLA